MDILVDHVTQAGERKSGLIVHIGCVLTDRSEVSIQFPAEQVNGLIQAAAIGAQRAAEARAKRGMETLKQNPFQVEGHEIRTLWNEDGKRWEVEVLVKFGPAHGLDYAIPPEDARKMANVMLEAADLAERQPKPTANN